MCGLSSAGSAQVGDTLRVATYNAGLDRKGPGLLLRDILRGDSPDILAALDVISETSPDILALQGIDWDLAGSALAALRAQLSERGLDYPHVFAPRPNTGMATGIDLDGDGRTSEPRDAQGYGRFTGQGGMALLSRFPIIREDVQDFSALIWRDLPWATLPEVDGAPFPSPEAQAVQRLSTTGHWVVPIDVPDLGRVTVMTFYASPPVFDGPEDRNGLRNHDEIVFWQHFLDGGIGQPPQGRFVLMGDFNLDPRDGAGLKSAIRQTLADPRLQDPRPASAGSGAASGDPYDTVDWPEPDPGNLRVDYVLPDADWQVLDAQVHWPAPDTDASRTAADASAHRLVWVDLSP